MTGAGGGHEGEPGRPVNGVVTAEAMLPDVIRAYPQTRAVFDRYGLRGCGGPYGPAESVGYFARAHGVDTDQLVHELREAVDTRGGAAESQPALSQTDELADTIYRRFFKAGIVVVMTAGAVWGAVLLLRIGMSGSFTAISIHEINAHGHAQIFGWVGLFVMGFAYQAFPRIKHTSLWRPELANLSFYLMVFGVFARALGEPLFTVPGFRVLAVTANLAELLAIGLFITIIVQTFRGSGKRYEVHDAYIVAAMGFFLIQAVYDLGLMVRTTGAVTRERLLHLVSVYQAPLRDLQIHGFAMLMILGVGLRMFPALFGLPRVRPGLAKAGLVVLIVAILGEVNLFILMRRLGEPWAMAGLYASMLVVAGVSIALTFPWAWGRATEEDRSLKFVRTAAVWLHVSMVLLVLMPIYTYLVLPAVPVLSASGEASVGMGFSHAYFGAVRHAITVGFISLMILGMAAKVVPTLNGVDLRQLRALWVPFVLINVGCLMRVTFQIGTDFAEGAYYVAGVSGLLEVTAIAIWGLHLWRIMNGWNPAEASAGARPERITADDKVGRVVEWFPQTLPVLVARGFTPLANPVLRRTVARAVSVRQAAAHGGMAVEDLLRELNAAAFGNPQPAEGTVRTVPLPVLN